MKLRDSISKTPLLRGCQAEESHHHPKLFNEDLRISIAGTGALPQTLEKRLVISRSKIHLPLFSPLLNPKGGAILAPSRHWEARGNPPVQSKQARTTRASYRSRGPRAPQGTGPPRASPLWTPPVRVSLQAPLLLFNDAISEILNILAKWDH